MLGSTSHKDLIWVKPTLNPKPFTNNPLVLIYLLTIYMHLLTYYPPINLPIYRGHLRNSVRARATAVALTSAELHHRGELRTYRDHHHVVGGGSEHFGYGLQRALGAATEPLRSDLGLALARGGNTELKLIYSNSQRCSLV
jgi:hypothetical protein